MSTDTLTQLRAGMLTGTKRLVLSSGLTKFPTEIFDLTDSLEFLDLTGNQLSDLPDDLYRLHKLRILFCSENLFTHVPASIGYCSNLSMLGFKSNQIDTVDEASLPPSLRWLILTNNRIQQLPSSIGRCVDMQKLMLAGNRLKELPNEMAACVKLELLRLSSNQFRTLPDWLLALPRLSWLALADNPFSPIPEDALQAITTVDWANITLHDKLGEGASGIIYKAHWQPHSDIVARPVAIKLFKGAITSDGLPSSEMAASIAAGAHPHLIEVLGKITSHPDDTAGLVMPLIDPSFRVLAGPPSLDSCTRDIYPDHQEFSLPTVVRIALGVASAAKHLHDRNIIHGDLYAHNVLWNPEGECLLGDFGAASSYPAENDTLARSLQSLEVRAFGCLLEELLIHVESNDNRQPNVDFLWALQKRCMTSEVAKRPLFSELQMELQTLSNATDKL